MKKATCLLPFFALLSLPLSAQLAETTEPAYLRFAHSDAQLVAGLNWKATQHGTEVSSMWRALGDTLGNVDGFLITSSETAEQFRQAGQALIIAHGRFDVASIKKKAAKEGAVAKDFRSITLIGPPKAADEEMLIAFIDGSICLIGSKNSISDAIDRSEQPRNGPISEKNELFGTAMDMAKLNDLFVVTNVSDALRDDAKAAFSGLNAYAAGYKLGDGIQLSMHINAVTDDQAKNISKRLGEILGQMNAHFPGLVPASPGISTQALLANMKMAIEEADLHAWSQITSTQLAALRKKQTVVAAIEKSAPSKTPTAKQASTAVETLRSPGRPQEKVNAVATAPFIPAPVSAKPPRIVRIEGLEGGTKEIPYGSGS